MIIVVTECAAFVEEGGCNVADIAFIGGMAEMMFGGGNGIAAKMEGLRRREDDDLRAQAVIALACDYTPEHLIGDREAVRLAVRTRTDDAPALCAAFNEARLAWARQVAPTLEVVRR